MLHQEKIWISRFYQEKKQWLSSPIEIAKFSKIMGVKTKKPSLMCPLFDGFLEHLDGGYQKNNGIENLNR